MKESKTRDLPAALHIIGYATKPIVLFACELCQLATSRKTKLPVPASPVVTITVLYRLSTTKLYDTMAAVTVVSENSVRRIEDEGEFNTFFRENPAAQVSTEPLFYAEEGLPFKVNSCLRRILYCCSGTLSTPPVNTSEEKLIRCFLRD